MTDHIHKKGKGSEQELEAIFALAKPRAAPPEHVTRRVWNAVYEEWRSGNPQHRGRGKVRFVAIAASLVAAVLVGVALVLQTGTGSVAFDTVEVARVTGETSLSPISGETELLVAGQALSLSRGDAIETGATGGTALTLGGGRELRLGAATRAIIANSQSLELEYGKLYFDSGTESTRAGEVVIATEKGEVRHLGTRFLVALTPAELRVDVRDGRVEVKGTTGGPRIAGPGQALVLFDNGENTLDYGGAFGPRWRWADALVPPLQIEGMSLHTVINWAARESGRTVQYANTVLEVAAKETVLHGDLVLTDPMRGLSQTMLTTRLDYQVNNDVILIISRG